MKSEIYEKAGYLRIDPSVLFDMTYEEYLLYLKGNNQSVLDEQIRADYLNFVNGTYVAFATHQPSNYPKGQLLSIVENKPKEEVDPAKAWEAYFRKMGIKLQTGGGKDGRVT